MVILLILNGALVNQHNETKDTPLNVALKNNSQACLKILLSNHGRPFFGTITRENAINLYSLITPFVSHHVSSAIIRTVTSDISLFFQNLLEYKASQTHSFDDIATNWEDIITKIQICFRNFEFKKNFKWKEPNSLRFVSYQKNILKIAYYQLDSIKNQVREMLRSDTLVEIEMFSLATLMTLTSELTIVFGPRISHKLKAFEMSFLDRWFKDTHKSQLPVFFPLQNPYYLTISPSIVSSMSNHLLVELNSLEARPNSETYAGHYDLVDKIQVMLSMGCNKALLFEPMFIPESQLSCLLSLLRDTPRLSTIESLASLLSISKQSTLINTKTPLS